ncbi:MAG: hypothetical protein V9G08_14870 [Dermatophilaceae bacterium]
MPVTVERVVPRPLGEVWAVVTDFAAHRVPLTRVEVPASPLGVGSRFVAVSTLGPLRVADPMVVTRWRPPGPDQPAAGDEAAYAVVKVGRWLRGWAQVSLRALGPDTTHLVWTEQIALKPTAVGPLVQPLTDRAVAAMFGRAVDAMVGHGDRA